MVGEEKGDEEEREEEEEEKTYPVRSGLEISGGGGFY